MDDRRPLIAIALIMLIALAPLFLLKPPPPKPVPAATASVVKDSANPSASTAGIPAPVAPGVAPAGALSQAPAPVTAVPEQIVAVRSPLYRYGISTRGGRIVSSRFTHYRAMDRADRRDTLELLDPGAGGLLDGRLVIGGDTVRFDQVAFVPSSDSIAVNSAPATLTLRGQSGSYDITLTYQFVPDDFRINVSGSVTGLGPTGATFLVGLGNGFRQTEADSVANYRESGIVTKLDGTKLTRFSSLAPQFVTTISGPFEWVAVKSKYFVAGLFAYDSSSDGVKGRIGGVRAFTADTFHTPRHAQVAVTLPVSASGAFNWSLYVGPMEYDRLHRIGRDFDDVNPYGWAWLRPIIRPFAVAIRWVFLGMHSALGLGFGLVIVLFGIMVRLLTWPLNAKAMRSMAAMQAVQPRVDALKERYKDDAARLQQETFALYKEHKVNPLGGCWPMLIPYPLLVAVFFVLQNTIELRGVGFLWMPDLARFDPLFVIPVLMAGSMFALSKIGQIGMPPNPQTKIMLYMMPLMMLVFFSRLAAGLNLYYTMGNLVSLPQQWMIMKARQKMKGAPPAPVVGTKKK